MSGTPLRTCRGGRRYVATNLAAVLEAQGRKRTWLAERVGVSEALLYKIVAGTKTAEVHSGSGSPPPWECRLACSLNSASGTIPTHSRRNEDGSWGRIAGHDWP